jgi:hypothetical protein
LRRAAGVWRRSIGASAPEIQRLRHRRSGVAGISPVPANNHALAPRQPAASRPVALLSSSVRTFQRPAGAHDVGFYRSLPHATSVGCALLRGVCRLCPTARVHQAPGPSGLLRPPSAAATTGQPRDSGRLSRRGTTAGQAAASGKSRRVAFRRACDREFRQIAQQWARCSLRQSVFAVAYWQQVRPRCAGEHDAYRRLANRWLAVLWKLWQSGEPYDETYHLRQRRLRSQPRA